MHGPRAEHEVEQRQPRLAVGQTAPDALIYDTSGRAVPLSGMWRAGPTVLTFLRHFG
jgi:hypothetical protein